MKKFHIFAAVALIALTLLGTRAQTIEGDTLATSNGKTYKVSSLSDEGQKLYNERQKFISESRMVFFDAMIAEILVDLEIKAQNTTREKLLADIKAKVPDPTSAQIQAVYDANRQALAGRTLEEVRPQIVEFVRHDGEEKAIETYLGTLRTKYKLVPGKNVNGFGLAPTEVLATVGDRSITLRDFEQENKVRLNDIQMEVYEQLRADLESSIFSALIAEEAAARNIDTGALIAAEITDKLKEFTADERAAVEADVMRRLFPKYNVKILIPEPAPLIQSISVDDDPNSGSATAPVTVVMFTDFQCPSCSRTHPIVKSAIAAYGDRVRFVVRDYPLEQLHKDSFQAALAANAAAKQGKFFEYTEILYRKQDALDKSSLLKYAAELGLNAKQFELDFSDAKTAAEVRKDQADGRGYGVSGTPTIYVNGIKVHRLSLLGIRSAIDRALKK
jgi:protein-disulfide isomerase